MRSTKHDCLCLEAVVVAVAVVAVVDFVGDVVVVVVVVAVIVFSMVTSHILKTQRHLIRLSES